MKYFFTHILLLCIYSMAWASETNLNISSDGIEETYISGETFQHQKVVYTLKDDLAIFEGDIILGTMDELAWWKESISTISFQKSIIIADASYRWADGVVPYQIASNVSGRTRRLVARAMAHWQNNTSIIFKKRTMRNANQYQDYLYITSEKHACWSYVGKQGGKQSFNVISSCHFGGVVHEFGHALGLWHEQSRADRDKYITIHWQNIQAKHRHNFNQHINDGHDVGSYDYGSIMHYGSKAFSRNGKNTISPRKKGVKIGQREKLSPKDIQAVQKMYPSRGFKKAHIVNPTANQRLKNRTLTVKWEKNSATKVYLYVYDYGRRRVLYRGYIHGNQTQKTLRYLSRGGKKIRIYLSSYLGKVRKGYENIYIYTQ